MPPTAGDRAHRAASPPRRRASNQLTMPIIDCEIKAIVVNADDHADGDDAEHDEDRDDKSWRTRGEPSPTSSSATPRSQLAKDPTPHNHRRKRHLFWRNVVRQFNFTDADERALLLSLTHGINWMEMEALPASFMDRHREIYYLISTADYDRSAMIQRDVTRTFSIFERSQLPSRERAVNAQQRALFRVLNAVAEVEDGYCQGMNFIAALFLVEGLEEADAYALFLYLLKKRHLARIYQHSSTFLDDYLHHFEHMLRSQLPDLHAHMQTQGFAVSMYGIEWFTTLFSLSTKPDLACAIFDLFFVGVQDVFLRIGVAILKLLESSLMCMTFEDFLRDFKPLVRSIDPYHAVLTALALRPNPHVPKGEDTTAVVARQHYLRASQTPPSASTRTSPPRAFQLHRTLPPDIKTAIERGDLDQVSELWHSLTALHRTPGFCQVLANELLYSAIWHGHVPIALYAVQDCDADVNSGDDTALTPLHFAVVRNQPDMVRLLLCFGADPSRRGGRWNGTAHGLAPLKTAKYWKFRDTTAVRLVLDGHVCLCCNRKFDTFALYSETCPQCTYTYCGPGDAPCIERHQCPAVFRDTCGRLQHTENATTSSVGEDETSRRSSVSDTTSSSFVYIPSPASDLPSDLSQAAATSTETASTSLLGSIVDWFTGTSQTVDANNAVVEDAYRYRSGLDFPVNPDWYCNARECHSVFTFFAGPDQCKSCRGFFCSSDFESSSRRCRECAATH